MRVTNENVDKIFSYHAPDEEQKRKYELIRGAAKNFAWVLLDEVPECADRSVAIRCLRECVMNANAAIALDGEV